VRLPQLLIASHNVGKAHEIADLLSEYQLDLQFAFQIGISDVVETGKDFIENAILKARSAAEESGIPALADDCGLEVKSLDGKPGIYSRRYAMNLGSWKEAMTTLNREVLGLDSTAYMCCALAMVWPNGESCSITAKLEGTLVSPRGERGFGFDPCFQPLNSPITLGEMEPSYRAKNNHRALAFTRLTQMINWETCMVNNNGYSHCE